MERVYLVTDRYSSLPDAITWFISLGPMMDPLAFASVPPRSWL